MTSLTHARILRLNAFHRTNTYPFTRRSNYFPSFGSAYLSKSSLSKSSPIMNSSEKLLGSVELTRGCADQQGDDRYVSGKPLRRGHVRQRAIIWDDLVSLVRLESKHEAEHSKRDMATARVSPSQHHIQFPEDQSTISSSSFIQPCTTAYKQVSSCVSTENEIPSEVYIKSLPSIIRKPFVFDESQHISLENDDSLESVSSPRCISKTIDCNDMMIVEPPTLKLSWLSFKRDDHEDTTSLEYSDDESIDYTGPLQFTGFQYSE